MFRHSIAGRLRASSAPTVFAVSGVISFAAYAQELPPPISAVRAADTLEEVIVTGSRIARPEVERLQPTKVISGQTFDERGYLEVGQALNGLPIFGVPPASAANTQSVFGIAQSFVDLYSLGSQRTLTLVNGRRFVSSNTPSIFGPTNAGQQVDLNVIPTKLIDRIETISVGGAPIYGSDAISGTVNIILKETFQGLEMDAQAGMAEQGDAFSYRLRVLAGTNFAGERGNVIVTGEFSRADGLIGSARRVYAQDLGFLTPAGKSDYSTVLTANERVASMNTSGVPLVDDAFNPYPGLPPATFGVTDANGALLAFAPGGSELVPYDTGKLTGNPVFAEGGNGLSLASVSNLLSPLDRLNLDALSTFHLTDNTRLFVEAWYAQTHGRNLRAQPAYNTAFFGTAGQISGNIIVRLANPFLTNTARTLITNSLLAYQASPALGELLDPSNSPPDHFFLARANVDLQSGQASADQVVGRGVVGAQGQVLAGQGAYQWEVAASYGYSRNTSTAPSLVAQNFFNAVDAARDPETGQVVCAGNLQPGGVVSAPVRTLSSTCAPLNLFGEGSPSQASRDYITTLAVATSRITQRDLTATMNGELFSLPSGNVKIAFGLESRRETASFDPDDFYRQGLGTNAPISAIDGEFHTRELFAELLVPVISTAQDIALVHALQFEGAVRHVDHSIAGKAATWTAGLRWSPAEGLQFRGNRTRSIRSPAITEMFLPTSQSFDFANDPCDKNYIDQGTAPATRAANCAAAGIVQPFSSNIVNASAPITVAGNPALESETADARTAGFMLRPNWAPHFSLTVDYVDIRLTNAIESLGAQDILVACYDSSDYPDNESCGRFRRDAAGQVIIVNTGYVNAGFRQFEGVASALDWSVDIPAFDHPRGAFGRLELRLDHLDTIKLVSKVGQASANDNAGVIGTSKSKGAVNVTYLKGAFFWSWQGLFVGQARFDNNDTPTTKDILGVGNWWLINSTLGYAMSHDAHLRLIVNNVFDKEPPYPALAGTGGNFAAATSQYFAGILGRSYAVAAEIRF